MTFNIYLAKAPLILFTSIFHQDAVQQVWSSVWLVGFKKWEPEHKHFINGTCAYMTEKRLWSSSPCFRKLPFVCEVPHGKDIVFLI